MGENVNNAKAWQDAVSAVRDCLSSQELHALLEKKESNRHVESCPHCQAELAMMASFESSRTLSDADDGAVEWIVARLQAQQRMATPPPMRTAGWRNFLRLPYLAGAAAAAAVIALGISLYLPNRLQQPALTADVSRLQTLRSLSFHLTAPSGNLGEPPASFHWERFPGASSYSLELLEVDDSVLWKGKSQQEMLPVSPDLKAKMRTGKPLAWRVTALDASGKTIAVSSTEHFIVQPVSRKK